jgi:hypothetical protein
MHSLGIVTGRRYVQRESSIKPRLPTNIKTSKSTTKFMKRLSMAALLLAFAGTASAGQLGGSDLGATAPTPGFYDISQLLTTGDTIALQDGALNNFYDNTGSPYVGSSFTTGTGSSGYVMNSLAIKFGGGGSVGYAGGNDTTLNGGWIITLYQLSGIGNTNAMPIYTNTVGALTGTGNSGADWIQITGFTNTLLPNTTYAWSIYQPNGYDDLAYATGTPYSGGAICRIPAGGGTVTYFPADADSATFNIGLSQISPILGGTDFGATPPTLGANDISQLLTTGDTIALQDGALNYFYDNTGSPYVGSSYSTGPNAGGYVMNGLLIKFGGGGGSGSPGYSGGNDTTLNGGWIITTYQLSGTGNTNATPISTNVVGALAGSGNTGGDWIQFTGFNLPLLGSTTYAWTIFQPNGYDDLGYATGTPYSGGAICRISPSGGNVTYFPADADSAAFAVNVTLRGYPAAGIPSASQNPVYALSPITLTDTATGPGTLAYQWQTNSDLSGGLGGTWVSVSGATNLTLSATPADIYPGGGDYVLDYQFIVSNSAGSVTSAPVALTVHPASAPMIFNDTTPAQIVTYVGGTASFSAAFTGTTPLTNDWQANTNGSFVNLPGQTNGTLTLTNVQLSATGSYQLLEKNSQGQTTSTPSVLTVLAGPPPPSSSEKEAYQIYTNNPYAYWRLNETNNPSIATYPVLAYDYSGHGYLPAYGVDVTTGNAGPESPAFPGFSANELSAGLSYQGTNYGCLNVPPLNLNTNTVTFIAWINPNGPVPSSTGLLFNRGSGGDTAGFGFNGTEDGTAMANLGYTWNNNASGTWGWNSLLFPRANQWNFVAYVLTPTNMTAYLGYVDSVANTTNFTKSINTLAHNNEAFNAGQIYLGADPQESNKRSFNGLMSEVALFNRSLSESDVLNLFLTGLGSGPIGVTIPPLTSKSVFSGSQVKLSAAASGSPTITYQWQSSPTGLGTFSNVTNSGNYSGATSSTLTITGVTVTNALDYQVVAANSVGSVTSSVATLSVTVVPPGGQWTVNFQLTNNTINFATSTTQGGGRYTGNGVLGSGTYWNTFSNTAGAFGSGTFPTTTDLRDDGVTHSGIFASVNGSDDSTLTATPVSSSISALLDQYVFGVNALTFTGVPDGIYNLVIYGVDGGFSHGGDSFTVNAANGVQSASTLNSQDSFFSQGDNTELFTNVQVAGGTLLVNIGTAIRESSFNGAQLQLISYSPTISSIYLTNSFANNVLTLNWPEGVLQTATNLNGPWLNMAVPPPINVNMTNAVQFFRLKLQ